MLPGLNIPGTGNLGADPAADESAQSIAKALFLAGKINCSCEVCKLLIDAGAKVVKQLDGSAAAKSAGAAPPAAAPVETDIPGG